MTYNLMESMVDAQELLDRLIRPLQERRRDRQAEGLGGQDERGGSPLVF